MMAGPFLTENMLRLAIFSFGAGALVTILILGGLILVKMGLMSKTQVFPESKEERGERAA